MLRPMLCYVLLRPKIACSNQSILLFILISQASISGIATVVQQVVSPIDGHYHQSIEN